jgi:hypothetical protein
MVHVFVCEVHSLRSTIISISIVPVWDLRPNTIYAEIFRAEKHTCTLHLAAIISNVRTRDSAVVNLSAKEVTD